MYTDIYALVREPSRPRPLRRAMDIVSEPSSGIKSILFVPWGCERYEYWIALVAATVFEGHQHHPGVMVLIE